MWGTRRLDTTQAPSHGVCPGAGTERLAHEPSAVLHLNARVLLLLGRLEHARA